jgi:tetratricopeptide (TPR) repeat protein
MKKAWAETITLHCDVQYIEELILELEVIKQNNGDGLYIPQFVLTDMLLVLSHYRLGNRSQYLQSLTDLQNLLLYDDGRYIPDLNKSMAWQLLGICQHVVGDLHGALQSYQQALRQESIQAIQTATENRIIYVERQLFRNTQP